MMNPAAPAVQAPGFGGFLTRTEAWLDSKGRGAWIAAMILGFVFFWPVGLALVAYIIVTKRWSKSMFASSSCHSNRHSRHAHWGHHGAARSSGNTAFDAYKAETLRRLEEEQHAFETFLDRLRQAKDKSEFDNFMDERARPAPEANEQSPALAAAATSANAGPVPQSY